MAIAHLKFGSGELKNESETKENKRERKFQTSWLEEFPGLLYAVPFNEKGEESQSPESDCRKYDDLPDML